MSTLSSLFNRERQHRQRGRVRVGVQYSCRVVINTSGSESRSVTTHEFINL